MAEKKPQGDTLARKQWERYRWMRDAGHDSYILEADENEGFYTGDRQWEESDLQELDAAGRPAETINEILPKINNITGQQIAERKEVTFKPRDDKADPATAKLLKKVTKQIQQSNSMDDLVTDVVEDGMILNRGFLEFTVEFRQPGMPGDVKIKKKHPKTILIDPHADSYDPDDWHDFIESRWMSYNDIKATFGKAKADALEGKQLGTDKESYGFDSIRPMAFGGKELTGHFLGDNAAIRELPVIRVNSRQHRQWDSQRWFIDPATRDTSKVPNEWDDDKAEFIANQTGVAIIRLPTRRIRHTITGDSAVLFDKWSIYDSFTIVPFFPMFRWGRALGVVTNLKGPQRVVNKMASQQLHILNVTANGGWLVEEDSLINMDIDDLEEHGSATGITIEYAKGAQKPEKIAPTQLSQAHDRLEFLAKNNIKEISTINDSALGDDREDVAAKAIVAKQARGRVNMRRFASNEKRFLTMCGRKMLELVQGFYTEPRILRITGEDPISSVATTEDVAINQREDATGTVLNDVTVGEYDVVISTEPASDNMQEEQFEEAVKLKELGVRLPDSVLIRHSNLENKQEIAEQMESDPLSERMREVELKKLEMEVVDTFASARKKDADAQKTLAEVNNGGAKLGQVTPQQKFQADHVMKLLTAAQQGEIKRLQQPTVGTTNGNR
jgi:hypothetical protein